MQTNIYDELKAAIRQLRSDGNQDAARNLFKLVCAKPTVDEMRAVIREAVPALYQ
jgi:hypothetical protein